jgi:hypothetical protein
VKLFHSQKRERNLFFGDIGINKLALTHAADVTYLGYPVITARAQRSTNLSIPIVVPLGAVYLEKKMANIASTDILS